jgi:hypothetical protein
MGTQLLCYKPDHLYIQLQLLLPMSFDSNGDPLDIQNILTMSWQDIGPSKEWINVRVGL